MIMQWQNFVFHPRFPLSVQQKKSRLPPAPEIHYVPLFPLQKIRDLKGFLFHRASDISRLIDSWDIF